jgi:hypothetical protein
VDEGPVSLVTGGLLFEGLALLVVIDAELVRSGAPRQVRAMGYRVALSGETVRVTEFGA